MSLSLEHIGNFLPLLKGRVDTGWVVGTGVEKHWGAVWSVFQSRDEASEVETVGGWVEVWHSLWLETDSLGEGVMDWPGRVTDQESLGVLPPVLDEVAAQVDRTSSRESLGSSDVAILPELRVFSVSGLPGLLEELCVTDWRKVFDLGHVGVNVGHSCLH